jgi:hypothetical protein
MRHGAHLMATNFKHIGAEHEASWSPPDYQDDYWRLLLTSILNVCHPAVI